MADGAFILIETAVGRAKEVTSSLKKLREFNSVDMVTGPYDVVAVIERASPDDIGDLVTRKINPVPGVSRSVACLAL